LIGVPLGLALIVCLPAVRLEREIGAEARILDPSFGIFVAIVAGVIATNQLTDSNVARAYPVTAGRLAIGAVHRDALRAFLSRDTGRRPGQAALRFRVKGAARAGSPRARLASGVIEWARVESGISGGFHLDRMAALAG
jgi:hypothetical protein